MGSVGVVSMARRVGSGSVCGLPLRSALLRRCARGRVPGGHPARVLWTSWRGGGAWVAQIIESPGAASPHAISRRDKHQMCSGH